MKGKIIQILLMSTVGIILFGCSTYKNKNKIFDRKINYLRNWIERDAFEIESNNAQEKWPKPITPVPKKIKRIISNHYNNEDIRTLVAYYFLRYEYYTILAGFLTYSGSNHLIDLFIRTEEKKKNTHIMNGSPSISKLHRYITNHLDRFNFSDGQLALLKINEINHKRLVKYKSGQSNEFNPIIIH